MQLAYRCARGAVNTAESIEHRKHARRGPSRLVDSATGVDHLQVAMDEHAKADENQEIGRDIAHIAGRHEGLSTQLSLLSLGSLQDKARRVLGPPNRCGPSLGQDG